MTKYIIYKEGKKIKGTTFLNYYAIIRDANKILSFNDFKTLQQAKDYIIKYSNINDDHCIIGLKATSNLTDEEVKIIDEDNILTSY